MLCFVVVMQSFIMNSHEVFIHIHQGCFAGTGAIVRLPQCQWSKPDGYGKISQCITTTKHSKAKTVCIFLGIYCISVEEPPGYSQNIHRILKISILIYWLLGVANKLQSSLLFSQIILLTHAQFISQIIQNVRTLCRLVPVCYSLISHITFRVSSTLVL